jgi:hypothetical protein
MLNLTTKLRPRPPHKHKAKSFCGNNKDDAIPTKTKRFLRQTLRCFHDSIPPKPGYLKIGAEARNYDPTPLSLQADLARRRAELPPLQPPLSLEFHPSLTLNMLTKFWPRIDCLKRSSHVVLDSQIYPHRYHLTYADYFTNDTRLVRITRNLSRPKPHRRSGKCQFVC